MNKSIIPVVIFTILSLPVFAQKTVTIEALDKKKIAIKVNELLNHNYADLLDLVLNPPIAHELTAYIQNGIPEIFINDEVMVDIDYEDGGKKTGRNEAVLGYLNHLNENYKPSQDDEQVTINASWDQKICVSSDGASFWTQVNFRQHFKGKGKSGKSFAPVEKVAEMQIRKAGSDWIIKITGIYFVDANKISTCNQVIVKGGNDHESTEEGVYDEGYYAARLAQGKDAFNNRRYAKAWFYLKDAEKSNMQRRAADESLSLVRNKIREERNRVRDDYTSMETYLANELIKEGLKSEQKKDYAVAQKYYQLAFAVDGMNRDAQAKANELQNKIQAEANLTGLIRTGVYDKAAEGYLAALKTDPDNSNLLLGLARAYAGGAGDTLAEAYFEKAIKANRENIAVYAWQAEYYKAEKQYEEAEIAYINYLSHAEVNDPYISKVNSLRASVKGIALYTRNRKDEALDSFNKAIFYSDKNAEAYSYLSSYYSDKKNYEAAEKNVRNAISVDSNYAPAYLRMAEILVPNNNEKYKQEGEIRQAIGYLDKAVMKDRRYAQAYEKRAILRYQLKEFSNAREDCSLAISIKNENSPKATWYRGKCYYKLNELAKAKEDYDSYMAKYAYQNNDEFLLDYGFLYLLLNEPSNAKDLFNQVKYKKNEAEYGRILADIKVNADKLNVHRENLQRIFRAGSFSREDVEYDLRRMGLEGLIMQEPMKSLIKQLK